MLVPSWAKDPKIGNRILCTSQIRLAGEGRPVCSADADRREECRPSARTTTASRQKSAPLSDLGQTPHVAEWSTPADDFEHGPPASDASIAETEERLGTRLPDALASMYRATDGVCDRAGQWWVIWPLAQMVEAADWLQNADGYPDRWIAFGDNGAGDPFCFQRDDGSITCLHMIEQEHQNLASSFTDFWALMSSRAIVT
jgi:hypothetical protein